MKAWELLDSPEKWTQRAAARDRFGEPALASDDQQCYCIFGALVRCYKFTGAAQVYERLRQRLKCSPVGWNDCNGRTYAEVHALLKELDI